MSLEIGLMLLFSIMRRELRWEVEGLKEREDRVGEGLVAGEDQEIEDGGGGIRIEGRGEGDEWEGGGMDLMDREGIEMDLVGGTEMGRLGIKKGRETSVDHRVDPEGIGTGIEGHGGKWMYLLPFVQGLS